MNLGPHAALPTELYLPPLNLPRWVQGPRKGRGGDGGMGLAGHLVSVESKGFEEGGDGDSALFKLPN